MFLTWKKIRIDMLFSPTEMKFIQSNHGVFKRFTNQNRALIKWKILSILISTNQNWLSMVMKLSKNLLSTNRNWVLLLIVFSTILISNNQNWTFFLVTLFVRNQPIRIQHFLKVTCLSFLKSFNHYLKKFYQKTFELPRVTLKEKRKNSTWFCHWWNWCWLKLFSQTFGRLYCPK